MRLAPPLRRSPHRVAITASILALAGLAAGIGVAVAGSNDAVPIPPLGTTVDVPAAKAAAIQHAYPNRTAPESTVPAPAPTGRIAPIPATLASANDPNTAIPVSPSLITVTNTWLVSNGETLVAVYAGAVPESNGQDGRFVIIRQNLRRGEQTQDIVNVPGQGTVRIDNAPLGASVETSAQTASLHFATNAGRTGSLNLGHDTIATGG